MARSKRVEIAKRGPDRDRTLTGKARRQEKRSIKQLH